MPALTKRSTVRFDPDIHKILKRRTKDSSRSISDLVHEALVYQLAEEAEDAKICKERENEPTISYKAMMRKLKADGRI